MQDIDRLVSFTFFETHAALKNDTKSFLTVNNIVRGQLFV
jgi:hypothetical protein